MGQAFQSFFDRGQCRLYNAAMDNKPAERGMEDTMADQVNVDVWYDYA